MGVLSIALLPRTSLAQATDNFNRANGPRTDTTDGGLAISSQAVVGTNATGLSGDMRIAETYNSNQFSQVQGNASASAGSETGFLCENKLRLGPVA